MTADTLNPSSNGAAKKPPPPHDVEAERSLLGALLVAIGDGREILELVRAEDFYSPRHEIVFRAVDQCLAEHGAVDLLLVNSLIEARGLTAEAGGLPYLLELADTVRTSVNAEKYAEIVRRHAQTRARLRACERFAHDRDVNALRAALAEESDAPADDHVFASGSWPSTEQDPDLVTGLLPARGIAILAGPPKAGKTWLAHHLALAVSLGELACGQLSTVRARALVLEGEMFGSQFRPRHESLLRGHGWTCPGADLEWIDRRHARHYMLDDPRGVDRLRRVLDRHKPRLLVLDSWRRFWRGKENDSDLVAGFFAALYELSAAHGLLILMLHHVTKALNDQAWTDEQAVLGSIRGSGDVFGAGDAAIVFARRSRTETGLSGSLLADGREKTLEGVHDWRLDFEGDSARFSLAPAGPKQSRGQADEALVLAVVDSNGVISSQGELVSVVRDLASANNVRAPGEKATVDAAARLLRRGVLVVEKGRKGAVGYRRACSAAPICGAPPHGEREAS